MLSLGLYRPAPVSVLPPLSRNTGKTGAKICIFLYCEIPLSNLKTVSLEFTESNMQHLPVVIPLIFPASVFEQLFYAPSCFLINSDTKIIETPRVEKILHAKKVQYPLYCREIYLKKCQAKGNLF